VKHTTKTTRDRHLLHAAALFAAAGLALPALAQTIHNEVEPNDTKAQALAAGPVVLAPGDTVVGNTTGATTTGTGAAASADYFLLRTVAAPLGVYRHRMLFSTTGTAGHFTNLRGFSQWDSEINYYPGPNPTGSGTDDATGNFSQTTATASTPARTITWYGFGHEEQLYDRVTGAAATTGPYTLTYERTAVTPIDLGTFAGGVVTVSTAGMGHTSNTEIWVYDSDFRPIPGFNNDDVLVANQVSTLTRDFTQGGVYYLAISGQNLANNLPSPTDDKMRSVFVYEFPDVLTCSHNTANLNCAFQITDGAGVNTQYPSGGAVNVTRAEPQEINWYKITLTAPITGACCQPDGSCTTASAAGCSSTAGVFSAGSPCGSVTCAQPPPGACCLVDSTCTQLSSFACSAAGGVWRGAGAACGSPACPRTQQAFPGTLPGPVVVTSSCFFDVTAGATDLHLTGLDYYTAAGTHSNTAAGPEGQLYVYPAGTYLLSNTQGSNNTTPPDGWSLNTGFTFPSNPGAFVPLHVTLATPVTVTAGHTVGFYLATRAHGIRRAGFINPGDPSTFTGPDMGIYSWNCHNSTAANYPYWAISFGGQSTLIGRLYYDLAPAPCYANCDASTQAPVANVADFTCFLQKFAANDPYANCDGSTTPPVVNVADFTCFLQSFAAGCP
jgi:hypothetical protein